MKKMKFLIVGLIMIFAGTMQGQISVRLHVGTPPQWGPTGYNNERYYYLPDIETYYDVNNSTFIYYSGNSWIHSRSLPYRYRNYDLYGGYKVVMNGYRGNAPYAHFREYRMRYGRGYRGREQHNIGMRHDDHRGRFDNGHARMDNHGYNRGPERRYDQHNERAMQGHDRGNDRGQARGNDKGHNQGNRDQEHGNDNRGQR